MTRLTTSLLLGCALVACDDGETSAVEAPTTTRFEIEVANISSDGMYPSGFAPGVWALHTAADPFFAAGEADRGDGLEPLAEDGTPSLFARDAIDQGFFSSSGGDDYEDAPIPPGATIRFEIEVPAETTPGLSFAMMLGESNDRFLAPDGEGIALFDADGQPLSERDVTERVQLWDAGTEADQPFAAGPDQAPRQAVSGQGAPEGVVAPTADAAPPLTLGLEGGSVQVGFPEAVSSFVWIMHGPDFRPFERFAPATDGLLAMARDGETQPLFSEWEVAALLLGAHDDAAPASAPVDPNRPLLTLIARLADDPDRFVVCDAVQLIEDGRLRDEADVLADATDGLAVWSVGPDPAVVRAVSDADWPRADQLVRVVVRAL